MRYTLIFVLVGASFFTTVFAQKSSKKNPKHISIGIAYSVKDDLLPEALDYSPVAFLTSFPIYQKGRWAIYSEIQLVKALKGYQPQSEWEAGMNLGVMYWFPLSQKLKLSIALGTGPHYLSMLTARQAHGFIFSDNLELGLIYPVSKLHLDFNIKARYRHISNAGLEEPNEGIDNLFFVFGVSKYLFKNFHLF